MRAIWTLWGAAGIASLVACGQPKTPNDTAHSDDESASSSAAKSDGGSHVDDDQPSSPPPHADSSGSASTASASTSSSNSGRAVGTVKSAPQTAESTTKYPYDRDAVEVGLKRAAHQANVNCGAATDEEGKATGPWGKTTVTVTLGHNGHSKGATVSGGFEGKPVGNCVARAFSGLLYPPFGGSDATVDWEVEVVKPAGTQ